MARKPRQTVSITEAAKRGFASRPTLYRAIKEGRLSVKKAKGGGKAIDVAELVRVFGEPETATSSETRKETVSQGVSAVEAERNDLKALVQRLEADLKREHDNLERERMQVDRLMNMLEASQRQLADQRPRRGLLDRLMGGRDK